MPRKPDKSLKTKAGELYQTERQKKGGIYQSKIEYNKQWEIDHPQDKVLFRTPEGGKALITEYVARKASEDPTNPDYTSYNRKTKLYTPSVTAFLNSLLKKEIGEPYSSLFENDSKQD